MYEYTDNSTVEKNMKKIILLVFTFMNSYKFHVYKLPKFNLINYYNKMRERKK